MSCRTPPPNAIVDLLARSRRARERSVDLLGVGANIRCARAEQWARIRRAVALTRGDATSRVDELNTAVLGRDLGDHRLWRAYRERFLTLPEDSALTMALAEQIEEDPGTPDDIDTSEVVF